MATKTIQVTIDETTLHPQDGTRFYLADAASPHPGALCADVSAHVPGDKPIQQTIRFQDAVRVDGVPTGAFTPAAPYTATQVNNLRTYLLAIRRNAILAESFVIP